MVDVTTGTRPLAGGGSPLADGFPVTAALSTTRVPRVRIDESALWGSSSLERAWATSEERETVTASDAFESIARSLGGPIDIAETETGAGGGGVA